mmetsp:Transcript_29683/g.21445  ORF Transcript_29683/g.21445 Transcript_29683/m.21445 type:complete len:85 (+) Transcript_29683:619-873(+)
MDWFHRACQCMVHEVCHLFGLKHCIYYECIMNSTFSAKEQSRRTQYNLCPICLKKLKSNIKFDCRERYMNLINACQELGFDKEA